MTRWGTIGWDFTKNLTSEQAMLRSVCPFVAGLPYPTDSREILNPGGLRSLAIYGTNRPIDRDWPPRKVDKGEPMIADVDIERFLDSNGHACSSEAFALAVVMLDTGAYVSARESVLASTAPNFVFMITVLGDPEVDRIYESAVKPTLEANGLQVARADEIRRAGLVMDSVNQAIASSRFVVADLTRARPNTYYEVGYAHALGKPVILIAKTETERHFDIAGHRWNHWKPDADFRPIFDAEVRGVLKQLSESKRGVASDG